METGRMVRGAGSGVRRPCWGQMGWAHLWATRGGRPGFALAWSALALFVMVLMVGLSIDWGKVVWNVHQMQNAADAAALAGAIVVKGDRTPGYAVTLERTHDLAQQNWADRLPVTLRTTLQAPSLHTDDPTLDIVLGRWVTYDNTFFPTLDGPDAVKAIVRRASGQDAAAPPLSMVFGPLVGTQTVSAVREAVAVCLDASSAGFLCLSGTMVPGLLLGGDSFLDVAGGGIQVNSSVATKKSNNLSVAGTSDIDCSYLNVAGESSPTPQDDAWVGIFTDDKTGAYHPFGVFDGTAAVNDPVKTIMLGPPVDPYVDPTYGDRLDLPTLINNGTIPLRTTTVDGTVITKALDGTFTLAPGYYPYGVYMKTNKNYTLTLDPTTAEPGVPPIYVFGGAGGNGSGLNIETGNLIGAGVTCYVTKSYNYGNKYGMLRLTGNGVIHLTSPGDLSATDAVGVDGLPGIALWQDPTNPNQAHLNGGGDLRIVGTIYFPDPVHTRLEGNLGEAGCQLVCGSAELRGGAIVNVDYDGRNNPFQTHTAYLAK